MWAEACLSFHSLYHPERLLLRWLLLSHVITFQMSTFLDGYFLDQICHPGCDYLFTTSNLSIYFDRTLYCIYDCVSKKQLIYLPVCLMSLRRYFRNFENKLMTSYKQYPWDIGFKRIIWDYIKIYSESLWNFEGLSVKTSINLGGTYHTIHHLVCF